MLCLSVPRPLTDMKITITPDANYDMSDAECDAILDRQPIEVQLDCNAIGYIAWKLYRKSQYASLEEAEARGAVTYGSQDYGHHAIVGTFDAMIAAVDLMDHQASIHDVQILISLTHRDLPECALANAERELNRQLIRSGLYRIVTDAT